MRYFERVPGKRLYLSPMNPDDADTYAKWLNDPGVIEWLGCDDAVYSLPAERKAVERMAEGGDTAAHFAIVLRGGELGEGMPDTLLGNCSLQSIDWRSRKAELGLFLGEDAARGKGYGREAILLLLGFAFDTLGLHSVMLKCFAHNARALACYRKVGFKEFGRRRQSHFTEGRFVDDVFMDILEDEYRGGAAGD